MLRLLLLRHAKSSWDIPGLGDIDRPLNARGRKAARRMGQEIASRAMVPELVLCSPSRRTRETWDILSGVFPIRPPIKYLNGLYDFDDGKLLPELIGTHGGSARTLLCVGHNPSLESFARQLAVAGSSVNLARLQEKYPTGALAVIELASPSWQDAVGTSGVLTHFIRPRDLEEDR